MRMLPITLDRCVVKRLRLRRAGLFSSFGTASQFITGRDHKIQQDFEIAGISVDNNN
jgi:hypothetical protein